MSAQYAQIEERRWDLGGVAIGEDGDAGVGEWETRRGRVRGGGDEWGLRCLVTRR